MKSLYQITGIIIFIFAAGACKTTSDIHNSRNSLDWAGTYKGVTPADNGKNTTTVIDLRDDMTYSMQVAVVDANDQATGSDGTFSWNKSGSEITLKDSKTKNKTTLKVGENTLLGIAGKSSGVPSVMRKVQKEGITEKYWKLIEINGKPVVVEESMTREPFIILKDQDHRVNGNGGCNTLMGTYEIGPMNRIKFSKMASTMMACIHMEIETEMKRVFEMADNYTLSADGKFLSLNRARMAPLARFEVVYLR